MKRGLVLLFVFYIAIVSFSQSIHDLELNPSFKGITIGAPISKYSDILVFSHTLHGQNIYRVVQSYYLSIFNIRMQEMFVAEKNGKVHTIQLSKSYPSDSGGATIFDTKDLLSLFSNLRSKYGNNNVRLDDMDSTPTVCGMRWKSNSVVLDIVYLFYGTFGNEKPKLQYYLYQREDDY